MKQLFGLKSFQQILFSIFLLGLSIGCLVGIYLFNPGGFKAYLIIPFLPSLFFIGRGLFKNSKLFFADYRLLTAKS